MSVSAIVAVYNGAAYLQEALASILHQTHPPTEIIVWVKETALLRAKTFDRVGLDPVWRVGEFIDWYLWAQAAGITMVMQNDLVMNRRWHKGNLTANITPDNLVDYARIVHAARRRQHGDQGEFGS